MNIVHGVAVCGDENAYRRILHQFLERYRAGVAEWRSAPADRGLVLDLAHQLKSVASYLGLERLAATAHEVDDPDASLEQIELAWQRLHATMTEALAAIAAFLSPPPGDSPG